MDRLVYLLYSNYFCCMKESFVRQKILEVASRLFLEQGYNLTGINQIIAEADIARGSLYNHFTSKRELLLCYLQEAEVEWLAALQQFLRLVKDPRKRLLALFDHRIAIQRERGFSGCRFMKLGAEIDREDREVLSLIAAHKQRYKAVIRGIADQLKGDGPLDAAQLTETVFLLLEGGSVVGAVQKDDEHLKASKQIIAVLI